MDGREDRAAPRIRRRLIMVRANGHERGQQRQTRCQPSPSSRADSIASRSAALPSAVNLFQLHRRSAQLARFQPDSTQSARLREFCCPASRSCRSPSDGDGSSSACPPSATVGRWAASFRGLLAVEECVGQPRSVSSSSAHQSPEVHPSGTDEHS